jgi:hypothetical protein
MPEDDAPPVEVIRGHLDDHAISDKRADPVLFHAAGRVGDDFVIIVELYAKPPVGKEVNDVAVEIQQLFLRHVTALFAYAALDQRRIRPSSKTGLKKRHRHIPPTAQTMRLQSPDGNVSRDRSDALIYFLLAGILRGPASPIDQHNEGYTALCQVSAPLSENPCANNLVAKSCPRASIALEIMAQRHHVPDLP